MNNKNKKNKGVYILTNLLVLLSFNQPLLPLESFFFIVLFVPRSFTLEQSCRTLDPGLAARNRWPVLCTKIHFKTNRRCFTFWSHFHDVLWNICEWFPSDNAWPFTYQLSLIWVLSFISFPQNYNYKQWFCYYCQFGLFTVSISTFKMARREVRPQECFSHTKQPQN